METKRKTVEYKFLRQNTLHDVPRMRYSIAVYLTIFQLAFIILYGFFLGYKSDVRETGMEVVRMYPMFTDLHTIIFVGFGFLMAFLKRYGYGSVGFNFLLAAYVLEWSLLIRGWFEHGAQNNLGGVFSISIPNLLVADYCAAAVLISFGAVLGKTSLSQLIVMATIEVVIQSLNEFIGLRYLQAYDVGRSMYVHVFGAYFGLAVAKVLHHKELESNKEGSHYHSDLFSMIGTLFLWVYWPSFNSAVAIDEGQTRAIVNTYLSLAASCIITFIISVLVGKGRINMSHIQNATLAGGVAVGTVADMVIQPFGALIIGSIAGLVSTLGYEYLSPLLRRAFLHDTCGVNNLFGMPGIISGIAGSIVAAFATRDNYNGNRLYTFYPARTPALNSTEFVNLDLATSDFSRGGLGRAASTQGSYQIAALALTIGLALIGGAITGAIMKLPIIEQVNEEEEMFDDEPFWITPEDYSLRLTEVRVQADEAEELETKRTTNT